MSSEFGQIEQKLAEYEMARQELGKINYNEKIDQIKKQLKYELMIEFLKVDDLMAQQPYEEWQEKRSQLAALYFSQVDPERSYDFGLRCRILEDSQQLHEFFWDSSERLVDKLTWQSMEELTEISWRREEKSGNINFEKFFFMPSPDPSRRNHMVEKIKEKLSLDVVLPSLATQQWRPSYAYPLGFEFSRMKNVGSANDNLVGMGELQLYMDENDLCGLTLDEYLFLCGDQKFNIDDVPLAATLLDESFGNHRLESYYDNGQLKFRFVDRWEARKTIFALNGWQWEIK